MSKANPYPRNAGFARRVAYARKRLEAFGRNCCREPYSRGFDACFEMQDGEAVVWQLMHDAIVKNATDQPWLQRGIENMGTWHSWLDVYRRHEGWL